MPKTPRYSDKQMIAAITRARGLVYLAAQNLGCDPATIFHRAQKKPAIREIIETERNRVLDFAEAKLIEAVGNGEAWAVCFLLKTQGRKRGFVERSEIRQESRIVLATDAEELSDDELAAIATGRGRIVDKTPNGQEIID
jgi:hypothetical protein